MPFAGQKHRQRNSRGGLAHFFALFGQDTKRTETMSAEMENNAEGQDTMTPLTTRTQELQAQGFTVDFMVAGESLKVYGSEQSYQPEELKIVNFFRFEGASDPGDMSILYAIETSDGTKGLLSDAFGTYSDGDVDEFVKKIHDINKQNATTNVTPADLKDANDHSPN